MSQFSSDKPQVFIPPAFEDFRGYLSVPYDRDVPFQVCQINQMHCCKLWGHYAENV